jgi:hypothetical protein
MTRTTQTSLTCSVRLGERSVAEILAGNEVNLTGPLSCSRALEDDLTDSS